jgi:hypothetical protein
LTVDNVDVPLPETAAEWAARLRRSRQALAAWTWEAGLPWADRQMTIAIAETEIAALKHYVGHVPVAMRSDVPPLVRKWDELRLTLLER